MVKKQDPRVPYFEEDDYDDMDISSEVESFDEPDPADAAVLVVIAQIENDIQDDEDHH
ncbi:hypothetical protein BGZ95_000311, partial [Linnemannia exigua]